jgi:crossover junction endodeoxyribonuclease RuvC
MFYHRNADSALKLGQARGVAMIALIHASLDVTEIAPTEVKKSVGAFGRATKEQIRSTVQMLLNYREDLALDESDALAIAIARLHQNPRLSRKTL